MVSLCVSLCCLCGRSWSSLLLSCPAGTSAPFISLTQQYINPSSPSSLRQIVLLLRVVLCYQAYLVLCLLFMFASVLTHLSLCYRISCASQRASSRDLGKYGEVLGSSGVIPFLLSTLWRKWKVFDHSVCSGDGAERLLKLCQGQWSVADYSVVFQIGSRFRMEQWGPAGSVSAWMNWHYVTKATHLMLSLICPLK